MVLRTVLNRRWGRKGECRLDYSPLPSLLLKVVLTPALIAAASLAGRRGASAQPSWQR